MLRTVSATDISIKLATLRGTLKVEEAQGRFGAYIAISDEFGLICVADSREDARAIYGVEVTS